MTAPHQPDADALAARPYITCRALIDFIADYLSGELPTDERSEFDRHLAVCPSCIHYLDTYKQTLRMSRLAAALPEPASLPPLPEELVRAILAANQPAESSR